MPSDAHAETHFAMTGHALGWPLDIDEMAWPVATDAQVMAQTTVPQDKEAQ